ncbi:PPC domain-containing DNA-binding protein [Pseudodesulfovibrio portus]|uniref:DNA-binding protein n=1 Tax=Pseudodesulfovibrio portus TaxID=231439 RepID=A0ABM8AVP1_9BACT|nr:PPC domain-containing DNA-binding protein [Pseudodesulfovibrio portus]BDQ35519.1 DNA-binding protein [Pseudodesulfovibrio portus]
MLPIALRLHPGDDVLEELERLVREREIQAACVLTCVGSLTRAVLRMANCAEATTLEGHFEIVSLVGLLSSHGSHLHIAISDGSGKTVGAHLLPGSRVYTTAEIVVGVMPEYRFLRTHDPETGYPELSIQPTTVTKE